MIREMFVALAIAFGLVELPAPQDECTWEQFHAEAYEEYADEFTALFNAIETKWTRNGRLMIKPVGAKSFRFAKRS